MARIAVTGVSGKSGRYFLQCLQDDHERCPQNEYSFILHREPDLELVNCMENAGKTLGKETGKP